MESSNLLDKEIMKLKDDKKEVFWKNSEEVIFNPKPLIKDISENDLSTYSCTLPKFAAYIDSTNGAKNSVIRNRKKTYTGGFPWYHQAKSAIKNSLEQGNFNSILKAINSLNTADTKSLKPNSKRNIIYSSKVLVNYMNTKIPLEYRIAKKEIFTPNSKEFNYSGIKLTMSGIIFFKIEISGEIYIGAQYVNCTKTPFSSIQRMVVSFLIYEFISENLLESDQMVSPEYCVCIDSESKSFTSCPNKTNVGKMRNLIEKEAREYKKRWLTIE